LNIAGGKGILKLKFNENLKSFIFLSSKIITRPSLPYFNKLTLTNNLIRIIDRTPINRLMNSIIKAHKIQTILW